MSDNIRTFLLFLAILALTGCSDKSPMDRIVEVVEDLPSTSEYPPTSHIYALYHYSDYTETWSVTAVFMNFYTNRQHCLIALKAISLNRESECRRMN